MEDAPRKSHLAMSINISTAQNEDEKMQGLLDEVGPYGAPGSGWQKGRQEEKRVGAAQHTQQQPVMVQRSKLSRPSTFWSEDDNPYQAALDIQQHPVKQKVPLPSEHTGQVRRTRARLSPSHFTEEMKELLKRSHNLLINDDGKSSDIQKRLKKSPLRRQKSTKAPNPKQPTPNQGKGTLDGPRMSGDTNMQEPVSFAEMDWSKSSNSTTGATDRAQDPQSKSSCSSLIEDDIHCPLSPIQPDPIKVRLERKATTASNQAAIGPSPSIPPVPNPALLQVPPSLPGSRRGSADTVATEGSMQWATDTDISYSETEDEGEPVPKHGQNESSMDLCATIPASEKSFPEVGLDRSKTVVDRRNTVRQRGGGSGSGSNNGGSKANSSTSRHPVESNYRISRTHHRGNSGGSPGGGGGDDDDLNDDRRKRQRKDDDSQRRGSEADFRRFACPYYRFDPTNSDHMRCKEKSFPTLARVKGHVLRSHLKPRQCERCCAFRAGDNGQISAHLRSGNCEKAVFVPMDPEVERKGNELSRSGCSKTWEQVCMVLFDCDLDDVPSPYFEDPTQQQQFSASTSMNSNTTTATEDPVAALLQSQSFQAMVQEHLTAVLGRVLPGIMAEEMPRLITRYRELEQNHLQQQQQAQPQSNNFGHNNPMTPSAFNDPSGSNTHEFDTDIMFAGLFPQTSTTGQQVHPGQPSYMQYPSPSASSTHPSAAPTPAPTGPPPQPPSRTEMSYTDPFNVHSPASYRSTVPPPPNSYFMNHPHNQHPVGNTSANHAQHQHQHQRHHQISPAPQHAQQNMTATTSTITPATHAATAAVSASVSVISTPLSINNNHDNGGDGSHNIDVGSWVNAGYEFIDYTRCVDGEASSSEEDGLSMEVERIDSTSNSSEGDEIFWARGASVDMDGGLV